ncbi:DUF1045 domain-containing protein [Neorhizobium sp. JUb45]|uniref:DUF1045 domain-containing protein n=1 Tax=unclassified Neorhizobium TaxID=2629175 RepID=UPI001046D9AA|nr:DUF1045 domain-containing protein [Neorhizobium sp. JUb45]TCR06687.1 uncharacterized protein DUF1045 [Neorhizobium sp. JUb45]
MRYSINFTPPAHDPLTLAAAQWLGRHAFSGAAFDHPAMRALSLHDISFNTALPRRSGFHGALRPTFKLAPGVTEAELLRDLMRFAGKQRPFALPLLEVVRIGTQFALAPVIPCQSMHLLAGAVVTEFERFRLPMPDDEMERADPGNLSAGQLANMLRWGDPYLMDEFRFHMTLTGPLAPTDLAKFETALRGYFAPILTDPVEVTNLALFVEEEPGAPLTVHSLHPLGRVSARRTA